MKLLIIFAVVCSLAFVQVHSDAVERLLFDVVADILSEDSSLTVAQCTTKCDAVFASSVRQTATITDRKCAEECRSQLMGPEDPEGDR